MKISFNPSNSNKNILDLIKNNKDIIFDLKGHNIFARGVKFCGTDTWGDIKINNVSIGSNILDLRNGSNTTLTNTNGVVTINSTWRPVVDNLTSDSTTSSLSANQGRILAGLINGKSDSEHNHDNRYVKKTGDTMSGVLTIDTTNFGALTIKRNDDANGASIQFRGKSSVYGYIGLNNSTKDKQFLRWNSDTSKTYTILDTSSTYTSNGKGVINGTTITQVDNADKLDGYHASYSSNTPWGTIPVITTQGWMDIGKHLEFHRDNTTGSDYSTLLTCTGNYSNIVNLPSESGTLALLSQVVSTSDFNWTNLPGKVVAGNEFNIVNAGYNNQLNINYLPINNRNSSATITQYNMYNGNKSLASVYAYRFKADGKPCMWKDARNYAPFYATFNGGFEPILDIKTVSGDWSIGSHGSYDNHLVFAFTSDSDFNAGVNGTAQYYINTNGIFSGASRYIKHTPGNPQSYMYSTSTGTYDGAIQIREVNDVLNTQSAWGYAPRITFHWGQRYAKGFGMRSDGQFAVDDIPIALTSNVLTFTNENANYLNASFNNSDFSKKAASKYIECWDGAGGWWNWMAGKFMKAGSSDNYVLLGGGGHKPLSEFQLGSSSYLPYKGWWSSGSGQDVNDANGMIFAYATHKNTPFSSAWGIITTFDYTYNSGYKFQLAANGYYNAMYYRSRSIDGGGWTSWAQVIDTGNISSQTVANAYHLRINSANTWSTWYWQGQSGQPTWLWGCNDGGNMYVWNPSNFSVKYATSAGSVAWANVTGKPTIPNPTNYYWANIKVSASSNTQTQPSVNTIYANNWFRSQGNSGWFSESYGGGIHMIDTSWIRIYNGKGFYCDNQIYSSNSIRMGNILLEHTDEINNSTNGNLHLNYRNTGNVTLCNGGGAVTIGTTSTDIGGNKLYVNGSEFINGASNVKDHVFANGFKHRSHNSNDAVLLAGGGYSQGVPVKYWSIEHIIINGPTGAFKITRGGNYTFITKIEPRIKGSCTLTLQFPSGYSEDNTIIWAMGNLNDEASNSGNSSIYATIIHFQGSKYYLNLADDSTLNNGSCQLYFMCF